MDPAVEGVEGAHNALLEGAVCVRREVAAGQATSSADSAWAVGAESAEAAAEGAFKRGDGGGMSDLVQAAVIEGRPQGMSPAIVATSGADPWPGIVSLLGP
eukprot:jgi/Ulvmu1/12569/UM091_0011.1